MNQWHYENPTFEVILELFGPFYSLKKPWITYFLQEFIPSSIMCSSQFYKIAYSISSPSAFK